MRRGIPSQPLVDRAAHGAGNPRYPLNAASPLADERLHSSSISWCHAAAPMSEKGHDGQDVPPFDEGSLEGLSRIMPQARRRLMARRTAEFALAPRQKCRSGMVEQRRVSRIQARRVRTSPGLLAGSARCPLVAPAGRLGGANTRWKQRRTSGMTRRPVSPQELPFAPSNTMTGRMLWPRSLSRREAFRLRNRRGKNPG